MNAGWFALEKLFYPPVGGGDALPVFLDFVYKRVVPACFLAPLKPSFDLMDAQTTVVGPQFISLLDA